MALVILLMVISAAVARLSAKQIQARADDSRVKALGRKSS